MAIPMSADDLKHMLDAQREMLLKRPGQSLTRDPLQRLLDPAHEPAAGENPIAVCAKGIVRLYLDEQTGMPRVRKTYAFSEETLSERLSAAYATGRFGPAPADALTDCRRLMAKYASTEQSCYGFMYYLNETTALEYPLAVLPLTYTRWVPPFVRQAEDGAIVNRGRVQYSETQNEDVSVDLEYGCSFANYAAHYLAERQEGSQRMTADNWLALAEALFTCLQHLPRSIIHYDIKPENIILRMGNANEIVPFFIDFDVSYITDAEAEPGLRPVHAISVIYAPPELRTAPIRPHPEKSDVYSMCAAVLEAMLKGKVRENGEKRRRTLEDIRLHGECAFLSEAGRDELCDGTYTYPESYPLLAILRQGLADDPNRRPTAAEIAYEIRKLRAARTEQVTAPAAAAGSDTRPFAADAPERGMTVGQRVIGILSVITAALALILGGLKLWEHWEQADSRPEHSQSAELSAGTEPTSAADETTAQTDQTTAAPEQTTASETTVTAEPVRFLFSESGGSLTIRGASHIPAALTIPASVDGKPVTAIADDAFGGSDALTFLELPETVQVIGARAFYGCAALDTVSIRGSGLFAVGESAFAECGSLTRCELPDGVLDIGSSAFRGCALTQVRIPGSVQVLRADAFRECRSLRCVYLENGVREIGAQAFAECPLLRRVRLPAQLTAVGERAFIAEEPAASLLVYTPDSEDVLTAALRGSTPGAVFGGGCMLLHIQPEVTYADFAAQ